MAITRVNKLGTAHSTSSVTTLTLTVTATTTAGNYIIVAGKAQNTITATDSKGNNYVLAAAEGSVQGKGAIFYSKTTTALTSGVDTITITWSGAMTDTFLFAYEYSGLANFSPLDQTAIATATNNSPTASVTTTQAAEVVFGVIVWGTSADVISLPSGTELDKVVGSFSQFETQEQIVSSTGTYTNSIHGADSEPWACAVASFSATTTSRLAPVNSTAPLITGKGRLGIQLTCSSGEWSNLPTSYSYQWKRDGSNIVGATSPHYLTTTSDLTHALTCAVTAANKYSSATTASSNSVTPALFPQRVGVGI